MVVVLSTYGGVSPLVNIEVRIAHLQNTKHDVLNNLFFLRCSHFSCRSSPVTLRSSMCDSLDVRFLSISSY